MFSYIMSPYSLIRFVEVISCDNCQKDNVRAFVCLCITLYASIWRHE